MAIGYDPHAVVRNLAGLIERNMIGLYGAYESIDFTTDRLLLDETSAVVGEYMSHHQGMILMAMTNFLHGDIMVRRMHSDPRIQSVELLLQEQVPHAVPLQEPSTEDVKGVQRLTADFKRNQSLESACAYPHSPGTPPFQRQLQRASFQYGWWLQLLARY